uniref:Secreted protein n=1 Tax=Oryza meridionalis TaxID=40149 RepID=A0A0E0CLS4_9ORYZ
MVPYLARAVLATLARAFVPSCPRVWQTLCDVSSFTVRLHQLFGVIFLNDCRDCVTVFVSSASSRTIDPRRPPMRPRPLYRAPCTPCGSVTSTSVSRLQLHRPQLLYARLPRPRIPRTLRFDYID